MKNAQFHNWHLNFYKSCVQSNIPVTDSIKQQQYKVSSVPTAQGT